MKILVSYFSYSGDTEQTAKEIAEAVGGDLFKIEPKQPYSTDYDTCVADGRKEKRTGARPQLGADLSQNEFAEYDVIFCGYPIWWYDAPMAVYTFLEAHDLTGKTVVPFARSGGSGLCGSDENIQISCPTAAVKSGTLLNGCSGVRLAAWAKSQLGQA